MNKDSIVTKIILPRTFLVRALRMLTDAAPISFFAADDDLFEINQFQFGFTTNFMISCSVEFDEVEYGYSASLSPKPLLDWLEHQDPREENIVLKSTTNETSLWSGENCYTFSLV